MADIALGLTKKAVEGTVSRVLSAIDEDTKLKAAVKKDLRFIVGEFQMMESFLEMANDNKKCTSNKVVKTWVRQLREQAFDVEDCVEFVIHLDTTSARVRWLSWLWRLVPLPSCMTPAWVQDLNQAFAQLKQIKSGVDEVSQRYTRYNLLGGDDSGSSTTLPPVVPPEQLYSDAFTSTVNILRDLWKGTTKQSSSYKCNLQNLVTDPWSDKLEVILVCRTAGLDLEAAHILNAAYDCDPVICEKFNARARVKLMHPFNIHEFLSSLQDQMYVTSDQQWERGADDRIRELLSRHKYLIILEGLSSAVEWDLIRFYLPDCDNGSRIVISTEQLGFALWCVGDPYRVFQLALLPNDRYIYAFYKPNAGTVSTELGIRQLGQRPVIWLRADEGGQTASLVRDAYNSLKAATLYDGAKFDKFEWVNVPSPFSLEGFCWHLPGYDRGGNDPESYSGLWRQKLCKHRYLVVIEGLQSVEDWDKLKDAGLVPEDTRSCIVVIANEEVVAKHCEDDSLRNKDVKAPGTSTSISTSSKAAISASSFAQTEKYYSWSHHRFGSGCFRSITIDEGLIQFEQFITTCQKHLLENILRDRIISYGVFAVWGATGVGKSALVRFVYYLLMAYSLKMIEYDEVTNWKEYISDLTLFKRFGWVDVPQPFDLAEFSRRLLLDFNSYDPGEMEKTAVAIIQGHNPIQMCYETLHDHKCLVVIDGLRSVCDWDSIRQAFWCHQHEESCIFVIANDESVAKHCVKDYGKEHMREIPIRALDDKSAYGLFRKVAETKHKDRWATTQKLKHAKHIVPKCGGLPKIIDSVAKSDRSFWENINDDLVTKLKNDPQFHQLRGVLSWMHSYFDGSSDSVKPCVFYLSIFPTNYKIRKAHLLRRWITEGYSRDTTHCSEKENSQSLFDELVKLGIIQELPGMPLCQISGFFREYIMSQPMEDNLVFELKGHCKTKSQRIVQHLTVMQDWEREQKNVFEGIDLSRLRSLTVYGEWRSFFISDNKMRHIRVLDLEGTSGLLQNELKRIFGILLSLKFISLRGCTSIKCLPKSLGGLRQLESLDVRGTSIVKLPHTITKLKKIQYIRAGMFLPFEDWTSAASDNNAGSEASGTTPTPPQATISQDKNPDGARQKTPPPKPEVEGSDASVVAASTSQATVSQDTEADCAWQNTPPEPEAEDSDVIVAASSTSQATVSQDTEADGSRQKTPTDEPEAEDRDGSVVAASTSQYTEADGARQKIPPNNYKPGRRLSRYSFPWSAHNNNTNRGVKVPNGIEDMPALHTLGIVNISGARGKDFLTKLKEKTNFQQLLKLSVCGIKNKNWQHLCLALSHRHLESLSLGFDEDITENSCGFDNPPKDLKSLRLYGNIDRLPAWILVLVNLKKFDFEVSISSQEDMDQLVQLLTSTQILHRLCIKPDPKVSKLEVKPCRNDRGDLLDNMDNATAQVLKIDCSSKLVVAFQQFSIVRCIKVLIIHCTKGSEFRIYSNKEKRNEVSSNKAKPVGIDQLECLETVWLKGCDKEADYVKQLKKQIDAHPRKPVFKFEKLKSA